VIKNVFARRIMYELNPIKTTEEICTPTEYALSEYILSSYAYNRGRA
jgi:hypothetical protein